MPPTSQQLAAAYWVVQVELYCPDEATAYDVVAAIESDKGSMKTKATSVARHLCFDGMYDPANPVPPYVCGTPEYPVDRIYMA